MAYTFHNSTLRLWHTRSRLAAPKSGRSTFCALSAAECQSDRISSPAAFPLIDHFVNSRSNGHANSARSRRNVFYFAGVAARGTEHDALQKDCEAKSRRERENIERKQKAFIEFFCDFQKPFNACTSAVHTHHLGGYLFSFVFLFVLSLSFAAWTRCARCPLFPFAPNAFYSCNQNAIRSNE